MNPVETTNHYKMPAIYALVPAAGNGSRFGAGLPKQYADLAGTPVLLWTVRALLQNLAIRTVFVVVAQNDERAAELLAAETRVTVLKCGGATRAASVLNGLNWAFAAHRLEADDRLLVHDAARPGLSPDALQRLIDHGASDMVGAILALPLTDTLKTVTDQRITATLPREQLWQAQTPQLFPAGLLHRALHHAQASGSVVTDEAGAVELLGLQPGIVPGEARNRKITYPDDLQYVGSFLKAYTASAGFRVGQGYDVHMLEAGRPLMLGGVQVPHDKGLKGHSDGDAVLHALTDALLGAAGLGDIGRHYPDTDPSHAGADSAVLLKKIVELIHARGWRVVNADITVIAQQPRLAGFVVQMAGRIAAVLEVDPACVNVKAKTNEKLGYLGRGEAIEAQAVVLLAP